MVLLLRWSYYSGGHTTEIITEGPGGGDYPAPYQVSFHIAGEGCTQQLPHNLPTVVSLYTLQAEYTYSTGL